MRTKAQLAKIRREYYKNNLEKMRLYNKLYMRKYYQRPSWKKWYANYRKKNRKKMNAAVTRWYRENLERARLNHRLWYQKQKLLGRA